MLEPWDLARTYSPKKLLLMKIWVLQTIRLPDYSKLTVNWKNSNDVIIFQHDLNVKFFWPFSVSIVKCSYWYKCCVNIITSSGITKISVDKGLTRNIEIENAHIWRLRRARKIKLGKNVSYKMLLNAAKCQA